MQRDFDPILHRMFPSEYSVQPGTNDYNFTPSTDAILYGLSQEEGIAPAPYVPGTTPLRREIFEAFEQRRPILGGIGRNIGEWIQNNPEGMARVTAALSGMGAGGLAGSASGGGRPAVFAGMAAGARQGVAELEAQQAVTAEAMEAQRAATAGSAEEQQQIFSVLSTLQEIGASQEIIDFVARGNLEFGNKYIEEYFSNEEGREDWDDLVKAVIQLPSADEAKALIDIGPSAFSALLEWLENEIAEEPPATTLPITEEDRAWFAEQGMDIPPGNVLVKKDGDGNILSVQPFFDVLPASPDQPITDRADRAAFESVDRALQLNRDIEELRQFLYLVRRTPTGWWTEATITARRILASFGALPPQAETNLNNQEWMRALQHQQALRLRNPESGFGLTGNTSDRDIGFLTLAVAGIDRLQESNEMILMSMIAKQRRDAQIEYLKADYLWENRSGAWNLHGFEEHLLEWAEVNSFFTPEEEQRIAEINNTTVETLQRHSLENAGSDLETLRAVELLRWDTPPKMIDGVLYQVRANEDNVLLWATEDTDG